MWWGKQRALSGCRCWINWTKMAKSGKKRYLGKRSAHPPWNKTPEKPRTHNPTPSSSFSGTFLWTVPCTSHWKWCFCCCSLHVCEWFSSPRILSWFMEQKKWSFCPLSWETQREFAGKWEVGVSHHCCKAALIEFLNPWREGNRLFTWNFFCLQHSERLLSKAELLRASFQSATPIFDQQEQKSDRAASHSLSFWFLFILLFFFGFDYKRVM